MARAFIGAVSCAVTADRDLGESWAVSVIPSPPARRGQPHLPPMVVKLVGADREKVIRGALEILRQRGQIDRYEL